MSTNKQSLVRSLALGAAFMVAITLGAPSLASARKHDKDQKSVAFTTQGQVSISSDSSQREPKRIRQHKVYDYANDSIPNAMNDGMDLHAF